VATGNFYLHDLPDVLRFEIQGAVSAELADALRRSVGTASSVLGQRTLLLDLRSAAWMDAEARSTLAGIARDGARLMVREDHLSEFVPLLSRPATPAGETVQPRWRRILCRMAAGLRRGCRCLACASARYWSL
jgi:hypothetical protein